MEKIKPEKEVAVVECQSLSEYSLAKKIAKDYIKWLAMDLSFQSIDREFTQFEQMYGKPDGCYLLAFQSDIVAGGVGLRKLSMEICEMKRLYVYDAFKGLGLGKMLCLELIECAKKLGYNKMRLDTIARLKAANVLYEKIGFKDIPQYTENPDSTARFMEYSF